MRAVMLAPIFLLAACTTQAELKGAVGAEDQCLSQAERERLLALDQAAFDQDLSGGGGGWRAIAAKRGCEIAAANLIRDFRERHASSESVLYFHEGQMRANGSDYTSAISLFEKSRQPEERDFGGWNKFVDASIAFLRKDMPALVRARDALSAVKPPPGVELKDGSFEIPNNSGHSMKMRWPPNIDNVDGFIMCFDHTYRDVSADAECRPAAPK